MARPSNTPRLAAVDPEALARGVASSVVDHLRRSHRSLVSMHDFVPLPPPEETEIYNVVHQLAGYARGDHRLDAPVQEYLTSLAPLWSSVLRGSAERGAIPTDTELGVVIYAAEGRQALDDGGDLSTTELACLGGVDKRALALLCRTGEIRARDVDGEWRIGAREARRWLDARRSKA